MIQLTELDGMSVQLIVSDPWDFVTAAGSGPFRAGIVELDGSSPTRMLPKLKTPIEYRNIRCEFLVASPRHADDLPANLLIGRAIHVNVLCIGRSEIEKGDRFGSGWRGRLALIAELRKTDNKEL